MAASRFGERAESSAGPVRIRTNTRALPLDGRAVVRNPHGGRVGELARVRRTKLRLELAGFDTGGGAEEVEQLGELVGGRADHLDIAVGRLSDLVQALECARESRRRSERRPEVMARERN